MKRLEESINEYERKKREEAEKYNEYLRVREERKKELQENRVAFVGRDSERAARAGI